MQTRLIYNLYTINNSHTIHIQYTYNSHTINIQFTYNSYTIQIQYTIRIQFKFMDPVYSWIHYSIMDRLLKFMDTIFNYG